MIIYCIDLLHVPSDNYMYSEKGYNLQIYDRNIQDPSTHCYYYNDPSKFFYIWHRPQQQHQVCDLLDQ